MISQRIVVNGFINNTGSGYHVTTIETEIEFQIIAISTIFDNTLMDEIGSIDLQYKVTFLYKQISLGN